MSVNHAIKIKTPFEGMVTESNFDVAEVPYPTLVDNSVIVKVLTASVDPYLRGRTFSAGDAFANFVVGSVVETSSSDYAVGDLLWGVMPIQSFNLLTSFKGVTKIKNEAGLPLSTYVGVLGMPGMTAYGAITQFGGVPIHSGDVVVVSGAAGCVGSAVGQIARLLGAKKVIGVAGGPAKCKLVVDKFGFDACIDYKEHTTSDAVSKALLALSPEGVDYYYDNTGGVITQTLLNHPTLLKYGARVAICGSISTYNDTEPEMVQNHLTKLIYRSATVKGVIAGDWMFKPEFQADFFKTVPQAIKDGKLAFEETVLEGIDKVPAAFVGLFTGANVGKMVVNF
jgi:NADPH-dependent curcumin reductase CurA